MRMCDRGVQMLITTVGAFAAFSLMTIAVGTDYWLYSRGVCRTKSTSDNDTSRKNEEVMTHSGLWRTCCLEGTDRPAGTPRRPPHPTPRPRGGPCPKVRGRAGASRDPTPPPHPRAGPPPASPGTRGRRAEHPSGPGCSAAPPPPPQFPGHRTRETSRVAPARRTRGPGGAGCRGPPVPGDRRCPWAAAPCVLPACVPALGETGSFGLRGHRSLSRPQGLF